jgi:hypothetical protein
MNKIKSTMGHSMVNQIIRIFLRIFEHVDVEIKVDEAASRR